MASRVLLIGWDGADWRILDPLIERGMLPNLAALIGRGGRADLVSTLPTHSWTAWPSFLTGVDPDRHGVFDILEGRGGQKQFPVTYGSIRERTVIDDLGQAGVESLFVNVPLTFPPPAMRGRLVAGGVLPKRRTFTHPESLADDLRLAGTPWPINGMSWTTYRNRPDPFLREVVEVTTARQRAMEHLLDSAEWRLAVCVYFSTDRIQHCLTKYLSPAHPDYARCSAEPVAERVRDVYRMLDEGLGRLVSRTGPEDLVIFMSDHGFQPVTRALNLDRLLARLGFLSFSASNVVFGPMQWGAVRSLARKVYDLLGLHGKVSLPQPVDWSRTKAYTAVRSTGEGVSINLAGREPSGTVDPADYEKVRDEVADRLLSFVDPATGARPVARVVRREELYGGPHAGLGPDLILEAAPLFSLSHAKGVVEPADWLSGEHRLHGVLAAVGPEVDGQAFGPAGGDGSPFRLVDLAPTMLAALGVPSSVQYSGRVLRALAGEAASVAATAAGDSAWEGSRSDHAHGLDEAEAEEVEAHLRGLGYLE